MDSMINRYTADKKLRHDDAYTPGDVGGKRPDRATLVYTQRCKEAYKEVPVVIGGIEASLRRIAHYDYWSETIRRSILIDAKADILIYGNAERPLVEVAHRIAGGETNGTSAMRDIPPVSARSRCRAGAGWIRASSTRLAASIPSPTPIWKGRLALMTRVPRRWSRRPSPSWCSRLSKSHGRRPTSSCRRSSG
ncbi:hypothetical protein ACLK13_15875 [Escherichia coli]